MEENKHDIKPSRAVIEDLKEQGFTTDFRFINNSLIPFDQPDKVYRKSEFNVKDIFRFEGNNNPDDDSILYVIETYDGLKGTISNGYRATADVELDELMSK